MMNYQQIYQGMGSAGQGYGPTVMAPSSPGSSVNAGFSVGAGVGSAGPVVGIALAVMGGLALLYVTTLKLQGSR